jgi:hypothetical protein
VPRLVYLTDASIIVHLYKKSSEELPCCSQGWCIWQVFVLARTNIVLTSNQVLVFALTCATFTDSRWETDRWPIFVQVDCSLDVVCYRQVRNVCPVCGYRGSFSGLRRSGREFDHSRPTSADVKFEWIYTSAHAFLFYGGDRNNCAFCTGHGNSALRRRLVISV